MSSPLLLLVRATSFSAAHRYYEPGLDNSANRALYGSRYKQDGFGHNFRLEASFSGPVDPLTGMIINLSEIDSWLRGLREELDHKHLNLLPAFRTVSPTPERLAQFCFRELTRLMGALSVVGGRGALAQLVKVRLFEGETLWVDYSE